jgi:hypothetical protein
MTDGTTNKYLTENKRLLRLIQLFSKRYGVFGGVTFDLRHDALLPDYWSCSVPHTQSMVLADPDLPRIWFPWFGVDGEYDDQSGYCGANELSDPKFFGDGKVPECVVEAGDKILIERVEFKKIGDQFDHEVIAQALVGRLTRIAGEVGLAG